METFPNGWSMRKKEPKVFPLIIGLVIFLMGFALYLIWGAPDPKDSSPEQATATAPEETTQTSEVLDTPETKAKETRLEDWLSNNANSMNSFSPQGEEQMQSFVATLDDSDFARLQKTALNLKVPANKRILSTYLLTLADTRALKSLGEFISAPLEGNPQPEPHTMDEAALGREKAMRVMAIDHLLEKGKTDPSALQALKDLIPTIKDPWVRSYAERRLLGR